jgi:hypothetical protein
MQEEQKHDHEWVVARIAKLKGLFELSNEERKELKNSEGVYEKCSICKQLGQKRGLETRK